MSYEPTTIAAAVAGRQDLLTQRARMAHGGVIGVGNKAVVAFRFDDWQDAFKANIFALLQARGLPASMALIADGASASQSFWTSGTTWADVVSWNRGGVEMWSHGSNHRDPSPGGDAEYLRQIVTSKADIEAQGMKVQGWTLPGIVSPLAPPAVPYDDAAWTDPTSLYTTRTGQLVRQTYGLSEFYTGGVYRPIPCGAFHGLDHITVSDGKTLAAAQANVDEVIALGVGVEFMCHSGNLGGAGHMTLAEFTTFLDYIVTKRDAGLLEVLTPSGLIFADKGSQRLDLINAGDFESVTTGAPGQWTLGTGHTIETTGGHGGNNFLRIPNTTTTTAFQRPANMQTLGLGGETFILEGWCRSNGAGTTTARVIIQDYIDNTRLNLSKTFSGITTAWTKVRVPFSGHPLTDRFTFALTRSSGDGVDWDDVHVLKV